MALSSGSAGLLLFGHQGVQRGGQLVQFLQVISCQLGDCLVTGFGELDPGHPGILGIRAAAHEAGRLGAIHESHGAVALQQQVVGDLTDRGRGAPGMTLDRHQ